MAARKILVVGATGKQGSATIKALLALPPTTPPLHILGVTRNPESPGAQALAAKYPGVVTPVRGDFTDAEAVFANPAVGDDVSSLYLFTMPRTPEDKIGAAWVDAAVAHKVGQIVLSTVDRGGDAKSWDNPTYVPHFLQKHAVELHLRDVAKTHPSLRWTVLRPVAFMDNAEPGVACGIFNAMWASVPADKSLQLVSVHDIGVFAAKAIAAPDEWHGKAISLAGDSLTQTEAKEIFQRVVGQPMPHTWNIVGKGLMWAISDVGKMFKWFGEVGYGVDIAALRKTEPKLQDWETWLKESSKWEVKK